MFLIKNIVMNINQNIDIKILVYCLVVIYFTDILIWGISEISLSEMIISTLIFIVFILLLIKAKTYFLSFFKLKSIRQKILYLVFGTEIIGYCTIYVYTILKMVGNE